ncbi:hypothetical protein GCM10007112_16700 [Vulcanisaeta souniana JCM 11219]|nr:hypothetical protein GCM10007112_16700 [Vulcanisaeta souniana JCM 11219]
MREVNEYSAVEKGPGRPPYWEMVFWWTRKPLASARAVIASALLSREAYGNVQQFLNDLFPCRNEQKTVHNCNPSPRLIEKLRGRKLLDPFAGFGSIPLEGLRLGLDVTAVELLPTAYVFLKAILEYPVKFWKTTIEVSGKEVKELGLEDVAKKFNNARQINDSSRYKVPRLIYDVAKWGNWIVNQLRSDPDIKELYEEDVAVYIGTWEVKCPICGRYTPLVGNWWLARVKKGSSTYYRLAWMEWDNGIKVIDLNKKCREEGGGSCRELMAKVTTRDEEGGTVEWRGNKYKIPIKNIEPKRETAQCLYCKAEINHRVINGQIRKLTKKDGEWYVKWALRQWNELYEKYLKGEITLDELLRSPAKPRLLVKVRLINGDLEFEPTTEQDTEKLWRALEKLRAMWGDPDIPTEELWKYTASGGGALSIWIWGFDRFFKLFNPRQLFTLVKLVKLIREVGKKVEEERLREGLSQEEARKYAEAITTYLAIALLKHVNYNSIVTSTEPTQKFIRETLAFRGIAMTWNWVEEYPVSDVLGSFTRSLSSVIEGLEYLVSAVSGSPSRVRVLLDDASSLSKLGGEKFDVVVTDPPYAYDVAYSELSDFYYVWLKRALSDSDGVSLRPRFLSEAFFDEFGVEIPIQWQVFAPKEVSENKGRFEHFKMNVSFRDLLARAFANILRLLKDDGLLVVYYVAKKPESWENLVDALWRVNGLELVTAFPVATESEESVVARGKASVLGGYVSVWRKRVSAKPLDLDAVRESALAEIVDRVGGRLKVAGNFEGHTLWVYSYMAALEYLTSHYPVRAGGIELDSKGLLDYAVTLAFKALLRRTGVELHDRVAQAYLALRIIESERGYVDSDVLSHVERAVGFGHVEMVKYGLLGEVEIGGPRVAKRKAFEVLAPRRETVDEVRRVYHYQRGKSPVLDCFRQLQLNALAKASVNCGVDVRRETVDFARALVELGKVGILDEDDVDVKTARVIIGAEWWQ